MCFGESTFRGHQLHVQSSDRASQKIKWTRDQDDREEPAAWDEKGNTEAIQRRRRYRYKSCLQNQQQS